jgi:acetyl esterase/lipase
MHQFATRVTTAAMRVGLRASLRFSPRPAALLIRRQFARSGKELAAALQARAPLDIVVVTDERYDAHPDALLDVYVPAWAARPGTRLPTLVWTHGGAFIGGSKDELAGYMRMIADAGFTVVAMRYSLAPEERYPTQLRQVMAALAHLQADSDRLHVDPTQFVLAGDSAGAHITVQVAAIVTNPDYARDVGVDPTIERTQLRGVALFCGVYDLARVDASSPFRDVLRVALWAYSGSRHARDDHRFTSATAVIDRVTETFPATFLTVGNTDPLATQSAAIAAALTSHGVEIDTLVYPPDHQPPLGHEYQFDLDLDDAGTALVRLISFLRRHTAQP